MALIVWLSALNVSVVRNVVLFASLYCLHLYNHVTNSVIHVILLSFKSDIGLASSSLLCFPLNGVLTFTIFQNFKIISIKTCVPSQFGSCSWEGPNVRREATVVSHNTLSAKFTFCLSML